MPSTDVTITEATCERLVAHQQEDESFGEVIERLVRGGGNQLDSAGAFPGLGDAVESARDEYER